MTRGTIAVAVIGIALICSASGTAGSKSKPQPERTTIEFAPSVDGQSIAIKIGDLVLTAKDVRLRRLPGNVECKIQSAGEKLQIDVGDDPSHRRTARGFKVYTPDLDFARQSN
jgi:hypothetical protein